MSVLFNLFIQPIELIFEVIFYFLRNYPAAAIIAISLVMNFLALPLYKRADAIQEEERDKVAAMAPMVNIIKAAFKGDERYMMLTTYYRQQNYKQIYSLRSTFPLLLQVPFFIGAYHYLSNLELLKGESFLFLKDLGAPDALIQIGSVSINVMPILMTAINVVSALIYLRGFPLKDKIQTYGIAAIFLVLLYDSPSGLVFYWTLNQIFSVCKNIVMKIIMKKMPAKKKADTEPAASDGLAGPHDKETNFGLRAKNGHFGLHAKARPLTFLLGGIAISLLLGILIPGSVISASPTEFATSVDGMWSILAHTFAISLGYFVIWLGIYYYLSKNTLRNIFTYVVWGLTGAFVIDYMVFSGKYGTMNSQLVFDRYPAFGGIILNILVILLAAATMVTIMYFFPKIINYVYIVVLIGIVGLSAVNISAASGTISETAAYIKEEDSEEKILKLSKTGTNVIVFMLDRAEAQFLPYIMAEKPELKEVYEGFTYYPNVISYGSITNVASPALFGGYEYTPVEINRRDSVSLKDKQNEALKLMPQLFSDAGYNVVVCDPPYANYEWIPDVSIYDDMANVSAYVTEGAYSEKLYEELGADSEATRKHNFFMYSLFCVAPTALRKIIYNDGNYLSTGQLAYSDEFIKSYSVLRELSNITEITESDGEFLMIQNGTTHNPEILQTPEYEPRSEVTSDAFANMERFKIYGRTVYMDSEEQMANYHVNMASILKIGRWLEYMKEQGVYDNTRIIIVADHGESSGQFPDMYFKNITSVEAFNPLLLVKDFGAGGEITTSSEFMSNADVPTLAFNDIIKNPVNPYTGNAINSDAKSGLQYINTTGNWRRGDGNRTRLDMHDGTWLTVHDNMLNLNNWAVADDPLKQRK